ncbi:hypothetical protein HNQ50_002695 [Silvimonas terrae]|uniref:TnsA endonuclease N-terminal domain-containing protein n=1 Tax=Silvimonas terrae TaxID=300266 RepID=A0A840RHG1_9NEIS|nr:TnsA endonuclease N-terminal domain-containing protein [Silvimonas terrae]MBB5191958.1 hypothetical protein [Silvimonas terrae]
MSAKPKYGPVREIGIGNRGVSGVFPGFGRYESTLERDLMEILRFDPEVEHVDPQPVVVPYVDRQGKEGEYTPDGLIHFKTELGPSFVPVLYEVKYRDDFRENWKTLIPKFRGARDFARREGWRFAVYTENEIRTPYLENARFLWRFKHRSPAGPIRQHVLRVLWDLEEADPDLLLCALCNDPDNRAEMIPVLWHLVATGAIGCDLNLPLNMRTPIWAEVQV